MDPLLQSDVVWRLVVAALLGACLGVERSIAGKHAGMRTYALVSMGSALFVLVGTMSAYLLAGFPGINPGQISSSIVVGIGFIGAGLAALRGEPPQLTPASGIWVASGVGMAVGFGLYALATTAAILGIVI